MINFSTKKQSGLSLIEVMIAIAIFGILVALGFPSYSAWINNSKVRTGAESILNGLQLARTEAVRRNVSVQFAMETQTGWKVSVVTTGTAIQQRNEKDGSSTATAALLPSGATTATFNGLGRVISNADATPPLTQVNVGSSYGSTEVRPLSVRIGSGGVLRMCDPSVSAPDTRAC